MRTQVVCTVGASEGLEPSAPKRIDGEGTIALVEAAAAAGVQQFLLVSSIGTGKVRTRSNRPNRQLRSQILKTLLNQSGGDSAQRSAAGACRHAQRALLARPTRPGHSHRTVPMGPFRSSASRPAS
jgi:hypothetical protein